MLVSCCVWPSLDRRKSIRELRNAINARDLTQLYNLILNNPGKRPYLERIKNEILNGDQDQSQQPNGSLKGQERNATCEFIVADLANEHRLIFGALSDSERRTLVKRVQIAEKYNCQKNLLIRQAATAYDKKDTKMEEELMQLWNLLKPNQKLPQRITNDWQQIGFQGSDPATDFRGAGYLGLAQLLRLCQEGDNLIRTRDTAIQLFQDSNVQDHWHFFAVTGINITQKLLRSLKNGTFDSTLLNVMESEKIVDLNTIFIEVFDYWYFIIFRNFNEKWKAAKAGIMAFNQFFDNVFDHDFLPNHHRYLQDYLDLKQAEQAKKSQR